ncbi:hypothetical protein [Actinomadura rupiterrae]|uniref:hypothetical protein n=1 Tax=Actinomadura rupiterrae TaxID=559627 RepID=UPI0020A2CEC7|nr:hypothetical protein [Actinomadura rupiterrae]MCP2336531.1 hypothetical protein [Actinomadura rupiterrae]
MPAPRDTDRYGRPVRGGRKPKWADTAHDVPPPVPDDTPEPLDVPGEASTSREALDEPGDASETTSTPREAPEPLEPASADKADNPASAGSEDAKPHGVFAVRARMTWRTAWRALAFGILLLASAGFVAGGVMGGGSGVGSLVFIVLGAVGLVAFGGGFVAAVGGPLAKRPVLEIADEGVRRPASWPLPRSRDRVLPWTDVTALLALRRGVAGTKRGEQDFLVFLSTDAVVELAREAERAALIVFTLADVPATTPGMPEATRWSFAVDQSWDTTLPALVKQIRRRHKIPVVDRRTR